MQTLFSAEYQTTRAVDDISFHVNEGELVGYIGPNHFDELTIRQVKEHLASRGVPVRL